MNETAKPNPLIELLITLILPSFILMKLSGPEDMTRKSNRRRSGRHSSLFMSVVRGG